MATLVPSSCPESGAELALLEAEGPIRKVLNHARIGLSEADRLAECC